ncbi:MAG TPA: hypothetical protein DHV55_17270 [Clostridiaceae bacterium]|nr:hypothetical protein [Clostridiaceae bacterium]
MSVDMEKVMNLAGPIPFTNIRDSKIVVENFCSNDMAIISTNKTTNISKGTHAHNSYEFDVCRVPMPSVTIDNKVHDKPSNSLFAINPMQEHGLLTAIEGFSLCGIHVDKCAMQSVADDIYGSPNIVFSNDSFIANHDISLLVNLFLEELKYKQVGHEFLIENLALLLVGNFVRHIKHNLPAKPHNKPNNLKDSIKKAIDYMNENYAAGVSCTELAQLIRMDKYSFIRIFKSQTNKTPYEYLIELKIEKAKKMLRSSKSTITEISMACGFSSHSHFTSTFKRKTGLSPTEYRLSL